MLLSVAPWAEEPEMSALGHKRTFPVTPVMSALHPKADIGRSGLNVSH